MICHLSVSGPEFAPDDVARAVREKGLLAIEIELGDGEAGLDASLAGSVVRQARELGARRLVLRSAALGARALEVLRRGRELGMELEIFTLGAGVDADTARHLFELGVRVILKRDSLVPEIQDRLAGWPGAHGMIERAFRELRAAGFPGRTQLLGTSSVICRLNQQELPRLWEWRSSEGLVPYIDVVPSAIAPELRLPPPEYQAALDALAAWDLAHGGPRWEAQPPLAQQRCRRYRVSCLVDASGRVLPCAGLPLPIGDLRARSLREILDDSEVMENLRADEQAVVGPCAACGHDASCRGCRGVAFAETGDYLASDPRCSYNRERQQEIARLPVGVAPLIPQGDPMRLVDTLRSVGERIATAGVTVRPGMPFVDDAGVLSDAAYLEMMAQAAAAMGGFGKRGRAEREAGLMLGTRNLEILGQARVGDELEIEVFKSARLGGFGIVQGCVRRREDVLARGEIKILQLGSQEVS